MAHRNDDILPYRQQKNARKISLLEGERTQSSEARLRYRDPKLLATIGGRSLPVPAAPKNHYE